MQIIVKKLMLWAGLTALIGVPSAELVASMAGEGATSAPSETYGPAPAPQAGLAREVLNVSAATKSDGVPGISPLPYTIPLEMRILGEQGPRVVIATRKPDPDERSGARERALPAAAPRDKGPISLATLSAPTPMPAGARPEPPVKRVATRYVPPAQVAPQEVVPEAANPNYLDLVRRLKEERDAGIDPYAQGPELAYRDEEVEVFVIGPNRNTRRRPLTFYLR